MGCAMCEILERPAVARCGRHDETLGRTQDHAMTQAALWIVDVLAQELPRDSGKSRSELVEVLLRHAGYEQADNLLPASTEQLRAELVARVAGRLARD
jgi:hypothetical protein